MARFISASGTKVFRKAKERGADKVASCIVVSSKKGTTMVQVPKRYVTALNTQANGKRE